MVVNEHERLSNFTLRHKLKYWNKAYIAVLHFTVTIGSSIMCIPYAMNKGNNKITELRTILQRESQNS